MLAVNDNGGDLVLYDYWNRLSPKVVQHGAGVINLFFQEAEKAKNDPKFTKKEKKNFLTEIVDAAKTAFSNIFDKTSNKPAAVFDVNQQNQQSKQEQKNLSPTVLIDKTTIARGETLIESGRGFSPNSDVVMSFDLPDGRTVSATIQTDSNGSFQKNYVMPSNALLGQYTYYAKDSKTGALSNKLSYTVKGVTAAKTKAEKQTIKETPTIKPEQKKNEVGQSVKECSFSTTQQPSHQGIIINEVAWMGGLSSAGLSASDEWVELKNLTDKAVNTSGWQIVSQDEDVRIALKEGVSIPARGFLLLERTNDDSVPGISADIVYTGALANSNEGLRLFASDCSLIDEVLANPSWPAGDSVARRTMQREGNLSWSTYGGGVVNSIFGTPRAENGPMLVVEKDATPKSVTKTSSASTSSGSSGSSGGGGSSSSASSEQAATGLFITEVQITAGTGKTDYDFVELFNSNSSSVNLKGHRLVKRTKTGTSDTTIKSWTTDTIVPANSYYLWANSNHTELGVTPDVTTTGIVSNDNGVAIRFGAGDTGTIIDSVGWGEAANAFVEGSAFATNPGANESIHRKTGSGYLDTNNNADDFELKTCLTPKAPPCTPANQAPNVVFHFNPQSPETNQAVIFDASSSTDSDGQINSYNWDFGDSSTASSSHATTTHSYSDAGSYTASLTVVDNQSGSSTASTTITVTAPAPTPSVLFEQPDDSASIFHPGDGGVKYYSLGQGADGSANKLRVKFAPDIAITADGKYHLAPVVIRKTGDADPSNWLYWSENTAYANQPKHCFVTTDVNVYKDITFTFPSALSFLAANIYEVGMVYLKNEDAPANHNVCGNQESVGNGNAQQGNFKASANGKIYFQTGN